MGAKMDNSAARILKIYPDANLESEIIVRDDSDGAGAYIAQWNDPRPQPTEAELLAVVL
jgi:hypothetical protein